MSSLVLGIPGPSCEETPSPFPRSWSLLPYHRHKYPPYGPGAVSSPQWLQSRTTPVTLLGQSTCCHNSSTIEPAYLLLSLVAAAGCHGTTQVSTTIRMTPFFGCRQSIQWVIAMPGQTKKNGWLHQSDFTVPPRHATTKAPPTGPGQKGVEL